jgi:hypothetical protein
MRHGHWDDGGDAPGRRVCRLTNGGRSRRSADGSGACRFTPRDGSARIFSTLRPRMPCAEGVPPSGDCASVPGRYHMPLAYA